MPKKFIISAFTGAFTGNAKTEIHMVPYIRIRKEHRSDKSAKNLTMMTLIIFILSDIPSFIDAIFQPM